MAGRKLSFNPETALNQMMLVFWEKGFNGTSIDDLCQVVGVPKPSIYSYFGDKETILIKALELYNTRTIQNNPDKWHMDMPFKERLVQLMLDTDQCNVNPGEQVPNGCMMVNTITEFTGVSEKVDEAVKRLTKESGTGIRKFFELASERKELKKGVDPVMLATQTGIFITGLSVMRKAGVSRRKIKELAEGFVNLAL